MCILSCILSLITTDIWVFIAIKCRKVGKNCRFHTVGLLHSITLLYLFFISIKSINKYVILVFLCCNRSQAINCITLLGYFMLLYHMLGYFMLLYHMLGYFMLLYHILGYFFVVVSRLRLFSCFRVMS